ncbi:hypothetical protein OOP60_002399 [Salmonella enterica]|nr:hypothetical protein [Salmonella enterica]EHJ5405416.1 hypothetical protein [Salmonella enterica subsp. enterica serovar Wedding]EJF5838435.1 hypothetical protein [Salmonella enterica]EJF6006222.1 hypothetical protein [Salmonella enterica]EJX4074701.1 hypothetical protein [Salmonella enterica]
MKAYFDDAGNLVIEAENQVERVALHLWTYTHAEDETTIRDLLDSRILGLRTPYSDGQLLRAANRNSNANCNAVSVTKSESE